jgi:hypothetical protein
MQEMEAIVTRLIPGAGRDSVRRSVFSIIGQALFYRFTLPALLLLLDLPGYPRGFSRRIARHITEFSLGGLAQTAPCRREGRRRSAAAFRGGRRGE